MTMDKERLKTLLGLTNDKQDGLLDVIIDNTEQALKLKLETDEVPNELQFIELEVCVRRFNRLKNEGMTAYTQEGESITFSASDFDGFEDDINLWKRRNQKDVNSLGHVFFISGYGGDSNADD